MTQFSDQVNIKLISQLFSSILRVFQKLLKFFHGTAISTFKVPASPVLYVNIDLNFDKSEPIMLSLGSSLKYRHRLSNASG